MSNLKLIHGSCADQTDMGYDFNTDTALFFKRYLF